MSAPIVYPSRNWRAWLLPVALLALVLVVGLIVRVRLLNAPLERDEGEHAYMAQTLLAGFAPWEIAYNMKLPGTDAMYALFLAVLGQTAVAIRVGLFIVNTATIFSLVLLGRRLFGMAGGAAAGAAFGVLSFSQNVFGTIAHSTQFVALFAVVATLLLVGGGTRARSLFFTGLVYGVAFLMKQPGIAFAVFGALVVAWRLRRERGSLIAGAGKLAAFGAGVVLPYLAVCLALWRAGVFGQFWFWTVTLARAYSSQLSFATQLEYFELNFPNVTGPNLFLWILAALGIITACWNPATRRAGMFTGALLAFSFLAVCAGGAFNPHYFILMLPAVALAIGAWVASGEVASSEVAGGGLASGIPIVLVALAVLYSVYDQRAYLFRMTPYEFSRATYGLNPFPEAIAIGDYIRSHSGPQARVAVLGSEAEIYFYSRRRAATGFLFTYGLMETHEYASAEQGQMIGEIVGSRPEYIVYVGVPASWMVRDGSTRTIFYWMTDYTRQHYEVAGVVDLVSHEPARYIWGAGAAGYKPVSPASITIYHRIP